MSVTADSPRAGGGSAPGAGDPHSGVRCPDHGMVGVASCLACGREVCERCLTAGGEDGFVCPDCGETGVALHDHDPAALLGEPPSQEPFPEP